MKKAKDSKMNPISVQRAARKFKHWKNRKSQNTELQILNEVEQQIYEKTSIVFKKCWQALLFSNFFPNVFLIKFNARRIVLLRPLLVTKDLEVMTQ